jgi:hypothetical protein
MWRWYDGIWVWGGRHGRFDCCCEVVALEEKIPRQNTARNLLKMSRNFGGFTPYFDAVFFGDVDDVT